MTGSVSDSAFFRFLRTHLVEVLTGLFVLHLVYTALLPFDFGLNAGKQEGAGTWWGLQIATSNVPDVASNIALYIPLGVLLRAMLVKRGFAPLSSIIPTVLLAAALSYVAEFSQHYSPSRISSAADFLCNVLGAFCGGLASNLLVAFGRETARQYRRDLYERPSSVAARLLAFGLVVIAAVPFDVTFTTDRLAAALKRMHLVPLQKLAGIAAEARGAGSATALYGSLRDWWMLCFEYVVQAAGFGVLAILIIYYLRRHCSSSPGRARRWALSACTMLAVGAGVGQVFILSRGFDSTYILSAVVGAWIGVVSFAPVMRRWRPEIVEANASALRSRKKLLTAVAVCLAGFLLLRETAPFRIVATADSVARQAGVANWLPMEAYLHARLHIAADDVLWKLLFFALLGAAIALRRATPPNASAETKPWTSGLVVAGGVGVLELAQLLLPSRIPALTDVLLALLGTLCGVHVYRLLAAYYEDVRANPLDIPPQPVTYNVELGPPRSETSEITPPQSSAWNPPDR